MMRVSSIMFMVHLVYINIACLHTTNASLIPNVYSTMYCTLTHVISKVCNLIYNIMGYSRGNVLNAEGHLRVQH